VTVMILAGLAALKGARGGQPLALSAHLTALFAPADTAGWMGMAGVVVLTLVSGLLTAAVFAARSSAYAGDQRLAE